MQWLNEAPVWTHDAGTITMRGAPQTDFWRITHDNGTRDSGHFYYQDASGDFVAEVTFSGEYAAQYDQAGLMLRLDPHRWIKCGIELFNDVQHASVVVTRDYSDWSVLPLDGAPSALRLRLKRHAHTVEVSYALGDGPDGDFTMLRQTYFPPEPSVQIGVMACAPTGPGFTARFEGFAVAPLDIVG